NKAHVCHLPELQEIRVGIVCGGEENVGVQENSVHLASAFRGAVMPDPVRVEPHFPDALTRPSIIRRAGGVGQDKLSLSFRGVNLNRVGDGGANQDSVLTFFGDDQASLLNSELTA